MSEFLEQKLTRRKLFILSARVGVPALTSLLTAKFEGNEIRYQLERISRLPQNYDGVVFFAKLLNREKDQKWQYGSGVLLNPYNILTVAHHKVDSNFSYTLNREVQANYTDDLQIENNITEVIEHPILDLAIVHLAKPETGRQFPRLRQTPLNQGLGPLTLSSTRNLRIEEVFAGYVSKITDQDAMDRQKPRNSIFITDSSVASSGDSGSPLFFDKTKELVGICIGGKSFILGLPLGSYYINLTLPEIFNWINLNTK